MKVLKFNYTILIYKGQHSTSQLHHNIPKINGDLLVVCVMFCRSLFAFLLFLLWSLCCLSYFELWILITPCYLQILLTHYSGWFLLNAEWVMFLISYFYSDFDNANTAWVRVRLCKLQKRCTRLAGACDQAYQLLAHVRWFSPDTPASSTTKTGRHDIGEVLLKVPLKHKTISKKMNKCFICIMVRIRYLRWDDDDVCFVLDQHD
jgi:hypothetical protein